MDFGLDNVIKTEDLGDKYFVETGDGYYYIPKNCSDSTNTIVYAHGAGGSNLDYYDDYLKNNDIDAIFVVPKSGLSYYDVDQTMGTINNDIDAIHGALGINNNNMETIGHSSGGQAAMYFMIENIKEHPEIGPQTCVLIDPATKDRADAGFINSLTPEQLQILGDNHSNIIGFEHSGSDVKAALPNYKILGDAGANVSVIGFKNMGAYDPVEGAHVGIARNAFNKGILAYLSGDKPLEDVLDDNVTVYVYDPDLGDFREGTIDEVSGYIDIADILSEGTNFDENGNYYSNVDFNDFNTVTANLKGLGDLENVSNDSDYVVSTMNEIRGLIRSTSLLSDNSNIGCQSTTTVPTCAENFLYDYYSDVLDLLDKLARETENAVNVGNEIDNTDKDIANSADGLDSGNDIPSVPSVVAAPQSSGSTGSGATVATEEPVVDSTPTNNNDNSVDETPAVSVEEPEQEKSSDKKIELQPYDVNKLINKNISEKLYDITADDLNRLFDHWAERTGNYNSPLRGTGESWIKACEATGLDPLTLLGICGEETGRGGVNGMAWMNQKNFFGLRYIDPSGDGTGPSVFWGGTNDVFNGDVDAALLASAKRIKNFYGGKYGGNTIMALAHTGYTGHSDSKGYSAQNDQVAYIWGSIMKESLDFITSTNGGR